MADVYIVPVFLGIELLKIICLQQPIGQQRTAERQMFFAFPVFCHVFGIQIREIDLPFDIVRHSAHHSDLVLHGLCHSLDRIFAHDHIALYDQQRGLIFQRPTLRVL